MSTSTEPGRPPQKREPLLIPDLERLRQKLAAPSAGLAELYQKFERSLEEDTSFRAANLYLPALLGDEAALREAKTQLLSVASGLTTRGAEEDVIENHTWCVAPNVMRVAVFYTWLDHHERWSEAETRVVAEGVLHFCYEHAVALLRGRAPSAENQSFSLALTCAVVGHVFRDCDEVGERALALHKFGMRRMTKSLGLAPPDGYLHEGSTYQSHVVSPLAMWAAAFLAQLDGEAVLHRQWQPNGASLLDMLRVETLLGSPGSLLPPWDHYGWQPKNNLAPIAYHAAATGQTTGLGDASEVWERESFVAWARDDRMWALIYWPQQSLARDQSTLLGGWSLPATGATMEHREQRARLMLAWDQSSSTLQAITRRQVNPNHLLYELDGKPIFGDGMPDHGMTFLDASAEEIAAPLNGAQRELVARLYGSVEQWANIQRTGLIGAANTVFLDGEDGYFPMEGKQGFLCHEERDEKRHTVAAESADYYRPRYDLTRARRTVTMNEAGVCWIVDDYRAASRHTFTWQTYLRHGCVLDGDTLNLHTADGAAVTLAWLPVETVDLDAVAAFPMNTAGSSWSEEGSQRLRLSVGGEAARFVVCLLPFRAEGISLQRQDESTLRAAWKGGSDIFALPKIETSTTTAPVPLEASCDLDDEPFALSDEPDGVLLQQLQAPAPTHWRQTTMAMQTLTMRGVEEAWPLMLRLLDDAAQGYRVHAVAAWCLGRVAYLPALEALRFLSNSPEGNSAWRAQWAVERIEAESKR